MEAVNAKQNERVTPFLKFSLASLPMSQNLWMQRQQFVACRTDADKQVRGANRAEDFRTDAFSLAPILSSFLSVSKWLLRVLCQSRVSPVAQNHFT